jgi:outer membrane protein assembly factor BamB
MKTGLALATLLLLLPSPAEARQFIVRLVCAEQPERLVSEVETKEEKPKKEEEGKPVIRKPGRYVGWMRFVTLDGKDAFKITYKGAYLKRSAVITAGLEDGEHVVQPGEHRFRVRQDRIETDDPDLRAAGDGLDILCYPVTFVAVDASVVRKRPMELKSLPVDVIVKHGDQMVLPEANTFNPLVLYMVSNARGTPYSVRPTGQAFRVTPDGVRTEDTDDARAELSGVGVENRFTLGIPSFKFPLRVTTRPGHKVGVKIYGLSGEAKVLTRGDYEAEVRGFYSKAGSQIKAGHGLSSEELVLEGDVAAFPHRRIQVDARAPGSDEPRVLVAAWNRQAFTPGEFLEVRVRHLDSIDAPTLSPAEVAVFLRERPVLRPDGTAEYPKAGSDSQADRWTRLLCRQKPGEPIYRIGIPARPTNIYVCRLALDRAGTACPDSFLTADISISLWSADSPGTLSVFTDSLRAAYEAGEWIEFSVVLKNRQPVKGGLSVSLIGDSGSLPLVAKELPEQSPGCHTFSFRIAPESTAALSQGEYHLEAKLGALSSNRSRLGVRQPIPETHFPIFSYPWGSCEHLNTTVTRKDDPVERERQIRRNVRHLAHVGLNVLCPPEKYDPGAESRESDTFGALVEKMMREDLGMPASELVYSRTQYEVLQDEMTRLGQRFMPQPTSGMMLSLYHSVPEDVRNTARTYALYAQEYRRFPNWLGFLGPTSHICVLGNSEVGDPRWDERMRLLEKNFQARYGHDKPRLDLVAKWVKGDRATRERLADVETKWMRWTDTINDLLSQTYRDVRQSVGDLKPDLKLGAMTFQNCDAELGEFITTMMAEMDVNLNSVGYGDYASLLPLETVVETMLTKAGGRKTAQWRDIGDGSTGGQTIAKAQLFKSLLGKVEGVGYFSYGAAYAGMSGSDWYYDEYREFNRWLTEYGDWYQSLDLDTPVCLYLSYLDSAHDLGIVRANTQTAFLARGAAYELARAHRMAPMLGDERIREGALKDYRILILPGVRFAPDDVRTAFEQFVRDGGIVMADEDTELEVQGATRIPKNFRAMLYPYYDIGCQYDGNRVFWEAYKCTRPEVKKLRDILDPVAPPFADAPSSRILLSTMKHGDGRYVFAVNDEIPYWTEHTSFGAQQYALPNKTTLTVRDTESAIYSVQERKLVEGRKEGGARVLDLDFEFARAHVFAVLPRPIDALRLAVSESATPGQAVRVSAEVVDIAGKAIRAAVPLEVKLSDAAGRTVYQVYRTTTADGYSEVFPVGVNGPAGDWRLAVQERLAGHGANTQFKVGGEPPQLAVAETPDVVVIEGPQICKFLTEVKEAGHGLWILLGRDQSLRVGPLAEKCAEALRSREIQAKVKFIDDPDVLAPPGRVSRPSPQAEVLGHVLLIGSEGENRLIEEICDSAILPRRFTTNYPGAGRALIQMARSPFALGYHALLVLGNDLGGLEKGVRRLAGYEELDREPDVFGRATAEVSKAEMRSSEAAGVESPLPDLTATQEGVQPSVVAFSPDGAYFAVGCDWHFHNLFLFERSGNLLWKQKVGRVHVNRVTVGRNAERICVATDLGTYLLDKSGRTLWRLTQPAIMNAEGSLLYAAGDDLTMALRPDGSPLWVDDPWQAETDPWKLNASNPLRDVTFLPDGQTVVLRTGDAIEYRDATSNKVVRAFKPAAMVAENPKAPPRFGAFPFHDLRPARNGAFLSLRLAQDGDYSRALPSSFVFSRDGTLAQQAFLPPAYYASSRGIDTCHLATDGTLYAVFKDSAYRVRPDGGIAWRFSFERPIVSGSALSANEKRLALACWGGKVALLDTATGTPAWTREVESGAEVSFSPDDALLVVAGKTGVVLGFDAGGGERFRHDLRKGSFIPDIEEFWAKQDQTVTQLGFGSTPPWHEVVQRDVPLSPNLLGLEKNAATLTQGIEIEAPGEKLATYFFAMRFRTGKDKGSFRLALQEVDAKREEHGLRSGTFEARPFPTEQYWVFKLSDCPARIRLKAEKQAGDSEIVFEDLRLHKMDFPSDNYLYHHGAFSQGLTRGVMENAPVSAAIYHMQWGAHATVWANPLFLMDGHVFRKQKELDDGWWFGGGGGSDKARTKITPCAMDIEFPEPKPISHIVLYDDEDGQPTERVCFQAWVDAKDLRRDKTEAEERMLSPGYWRTVGKSRWNRDPFQVFKFSDLTTRKIRFWYLRGPLKIDEIEIYGPEQRDVTNWFDKAWIARIPVKVNKASDLVEVEFQPQGLTRPDGADIRAIDRAGKEVPHVVKQLSPVGSSAVVFKSDSRVGTFFIYLGNDEAPAPRYDWQPEGGIWMESYICPGRIGDLDTWRIWNEAQMLKAFEAAKQYALEAGKKAEKEGKPFDGVKTGFVRAVGLDALAASITRYSFFIQSDEAQKMAFRTDAHSESVPSLLKLNNEIVFGGWNAFDPAKPPPDRAFMPGKHWGDAELKEGVNHVEFYYIGHSPAPLAFRPAAGRVERFLIRSRHTTFPGARGVLPERMQLLEHEDLGRFYLARARGYAEKDKLFDAQEMLLQAAKFAKDAGLKAEAKALTETVNARVCSSNWPMFHRNPQRTGFAPLMPKPGQDKPPERPEPFGQSSHQAGYGEQLESGLAVTDVGTFYGVCDHRIYKDGGWFYTTKGVIKSTPLIYGQRVYCGSMDGNMYCLTAMFGELVWQFPTGDGIVSSPFIVDDKLVFGSLDGHLYCLDPLSGQPVWKYRTGDWIESSPATDGKLVFVGSYDDCLHAVNLQTGKEAWKLATGYDVAASPCVQDGVVYCASFDSHVYAASAADGAPVWKAKLDGYLSASPAIADGVLVVGSQNGQVYALDAKTGNVLWKYQTSGEIEASAAIVGDQVYVPSDDNHLYVFDLKTGNLLAKRVFAADTPTRSFRCPPAYHRESLWVGGSTSGKNGVVQRWDR